jgi:trehalose-phosphatase
MILAGNYGLEIETPAGNIFCHPQARDARAELEKVRDLLQKEIPAQYLFILEDHGLSLCLHFHKTPAFMVKDFHEIVGKVARCFKGLHFKQLATSYEVWPAIKWDKSNGLNKMLHMSALNPAEVITLYAGDSIVDEPAFSWVNEHAGISILVGKRNSVARFSVEAPSQLHELVHYLSKPR